MTHSSHGPAEPRPRPRPLAPLDAGRPPMVRPMLALLRRLSLRHLVRAPLRSGLVVMGIALGVAVVVASRATSDGMLRSFDELVERVSSRADLKVAGNESGIPSRLTAEIAGLPGVEHAAAALEVTTSFANGGEPLLVLGVDFLGDTHFLPFRGADGGDELVADPLSFINDPEALLITRALAERRGLSEGSRLSLVGGSGVVELHVRGILEDSGPVASFGGQVAVMFLDAAQIAFARGSLVDRIDVALAPGAERDTVVAAIRERVGGAAGIELPEQAGERLRRLTEPLDDGLQLSGLITLIVGMFIIYNAIGVAVAHRRKEIGLLRALGVRRREVVLHFCLEACLLSIAGVLLGLFLAHELVGVTHQQTHEAISRLWGATNPHAPPIEAQHVLRGALAGVAISFASALLPARQGARVDPVHALRGIAAASRRLPLWRLTALGATVMLIALGIANAYRTLWSGYAATALNLAGAALLVPVLVVSARRALLRPTQALLGVPGRLGLDYVQRSLGRSAVNVLALMVAVTLSVAVSGLLGSFERSVRAWFDQVNAADLTVTAGSPLADRRRMRLSPDAIDKLRGVAGIDALQPLRMMEQRYRDYAFQLVASDTVTYLEQARRRGQSWTVLAGNDPIEPHELRDHPYIVLSENAAHLMEVDAGDRVSLSTPTGPVELEVRAVVIDYSSDMGTGFIDRQRYLERWQDPSIDVINIYLADSASAEEIGERARRRLGGGGALFVTEAGTMRDNYMSLVEQSFAYSRMLELIVLVIALLGVVGTMVAAVLDRRGEIGMLRAVGATRKQVALSMMLEAAFLGLCAAAGGALSGALQCWLLLHTLIADIGGWHLPFVFPAEGALRISVLVVVTAAAAGVVPALHAARLEVKDALAHE